MSSESLSLIVPDSLARELDSVEEGLLADLLERGLRESRIEQALDRYAQVSHGYFSHLFYRRFCT